MTILERAKRMQPLRFPPFRVQQATTSAQLLTKLQPGRIVKIEVIKNVCQILHS